MLGRIERTCNATAAGLEGLGVNRIGFIFSPNLPLSAVRGLTVAPAAVPMMPGQFVDGRMAVDNPPLSDGTASIFNSAPPYPASLDCKASTAASI